MTPEEIYTRIREHYGLERNIDFANWLGVSPQNANALMKRVTVDYDLIHEKFPDISSEWLLSKGEKGEMVVGGKTVPEGQYDGIPDMAKALDLAQRSLLNEQNTCRNLQRQIDGLLDIMKNITAGRSVQD